MGARNEADARASTRECLYRSWGIAAVRARVTAHSAYFRLAYNKYSNADLSAHIRTAARSAFENHYYESATNGLHAHGSRI